MALTDEEKGILEIVKLNKELPRTEIKKKWRVLGFNITYNWQSSKNLWGRFGGGWNWELGFQASRSTLILNVLVFSIRIDRK